MATIRKLRGRWQAMVRRRGVPPQAKSFDLKSDVERWARDLEAQVDRLGTLPDLRVAAATTLKNVLTRYRDEISPRKRSAVTEAARINGILRRPLVHRTLPMLNSAELCRYRDDRLKEVAAATVTRELNTISHAIDTAIRDWGIHLPANPCRLVRRPSAPRGRTRRLQAGEEQKLLDAAGSGRNPWMAPLIVLAIETGMRRGELLGLRWSDVDLDRRVAHLDLTKNGDARDVPLSRRATDVLRSLRGDQGRDPTSKVLSTTGSAVHQAWEHLCRRADFSDLRFHDLRHEAVSRLFEKGLGIAEVSAISGHKELRMLQRYTHLRAVDLVARLDGQETKS